jgi:hypothetical protein
VDSNYATDKEDRRSVSGGIHTVGGTIINWMSKTQASVTLSSTEAEYASLASGATQVKFVQQLLQEIADCTTPGIILEDNTGAIFLVKNQQVGSRTKHIDVRHHYIREMRERGQVEVMFVRSEKNSSDILTKNVPEKLLVAHAKDIRNGNLRCRVEWDELVGNIEAKDESIHHVNWEDVELWITQQTDADRRSELSMNVRDDYVIHRDSFNNGEPRLELCYV